MTQFLPALLAAFLLSFSPLGTADEASIRKAIEKALEGTPVQSITKTNYLGLYEVFTGENILYIDEKASIAIAGNLIDLKNERNVTRERMNQLTAIKFDKLPLEQAFKQVHGNGKRRMATFEDPNCGYCKRLAKELAKIDNVTIYTFLVPVLGPDSEKKSQQIWCAADPVKTWNDWMIDNKAPKNTASCDTSVIRKNGELAEKLKVRGTPALFFESGERIPGYIAQDVIEQKLGK